MPSCLSPRDSALLSALLRTNFDLAQVAFDHGLGLHELTDWLRSEAVQSLIADLLKSSQAILELRLTRARMETVGILESIAKTSEDPTERRRAATALFHRPFTRPKNPTYRLYSIPPTPQPPPCTAPPGAPVTGSSPSRREVAEGGFTAPSTASEPPRADSPSSSLERGGEGAAALSGGGGSISTPSTTAPSSVAPASAPQPCDCDSVPSAPGHLDSSTPCPPTQSSALSPQSPPSSLASVLFNAFFKRDTKALLRIFDERSTPDATLDNRPLRLVLHLHPLAQMHVSREIAYAEHARTPTRATYTFTFDRAPLSPSRAAFRFDLTQSETPDWLIQSITTLDSS